MNVDELKEILTVIDALLDIVVWTADIEYTYNLNKGTDLSYDHLIKIRNGLENTITNMENVNETE
jgi:hypothetical protein